MRPPVLDVEEGGRGQGGHDEAGHHRGAGPPAGRCLDEPVGHTGEERDRQGGSGGVDAAAARRVPRLGHVTGGDHEHGGGDGEIDEEDPAPRADGDEVSAHQWPCGAGHAAQARPGADGAGPVVRAERRLQDGQAARCQQRTADALEHPGGDEQPGVRRNAAEGRGDGEPHDPDGEDPPAPEVVAEGPAEEKEGRQRERVAGDHPLQRADPAVKVMADGGERDADDGRIEHDDARAEHRCRDDPASPTARQRQGVGHRPDGGVAAAVRPGAHRGQDGAPGGRQVQR